mgnify:FL=1
MFVTGLSGIAVNFGDVQLTGMVLACVVAMILSLIFYILDKLKLTNDRDERLKGNRSAAAGKVFGKD